MALPSVASNRQSTLRRRFRLQQFSTAGGLALALVLALGVARSESKPQPAASMGEPASGAAVQARMTSIPATHVVYYLVSSEADADRVRSWAWYEHALLATDPTYHKTTYVPVIAACGDDLSVLHAANDWVRDLRTAGECKP